MLVEEKYTALQKPVDTLENWCNIHMQLMIIKLLFETPHLEAERQNYMTCNNKHNRRSNKKKIAHYCTKNKSKVEQLKIIQSLNNITDIVKIACILTVQQ